MKLPRTDLIMVRNVTLVTIGTVCALRVREARELDVCDIILDVDRGVRGFGVRIKKAKNDAKRNGLIARVADGARRETCPRRLVMDYMDLAGLKVSERCTKPRAPTTECGPCGRLFRAINMVRGVARVRRTEQTNHGMSTHAVKKELDDCWEIGRAHV